MDPSYVLTQPVFNTTTSHAGPARHPDPHGHGHGHGHTLDMDLHLSEVDHATLDAHFGPEQSQGQGHGQLEPESVSAPDLEPEPQSQSHASHGHGQAHDDLARTWGYADTLGQLTGGNDEQELRTGEPHDAGGSTTPGGGSGSGAQGHASFAAASPPRKMPPPYRAKKDSHLTEEEKRDRIRDSNRRAAEKARNKKRKQQDGLEEHLAALQKENDRLQRRLAELRPGGSKTRPPESSPSASASAPTISAPSFPTSFDSPSALGIDPTYINKLRAEMLTHKQTLLARFNTLAALRGEDADAARDTARGELVLVDVERKIALAEERALDLVLRKLEEERVEYAKYRDVAEGEMRAKGVELPPPPSTVEADVATSTPARGRRGEPPRHKSPASREDAAIDPALSAHEPDAVVHGEGDTERLAQAVRAAVAVAGGMDTEDPSRGAAEPAHGAADDMDVDGEGAIRLPVEMGVDMDMDMPGLGMDMDLDLNTGGGHEYDLGGLMEHAVGWEHGQGQRGGSGAGGGGVQGQGTR